jgi:hypothetical protein
MTGIVAAIVGSIPPAITYANGLYRRTYSGYFNDNVNYFDSASPTAAAVDTSPLSAGTIANNTSYQWLGYWLATSDTIIGGQTYFLLTSDDASYMWIGNTALTGYTTGNPVINNGGVHSSQTVQGFIPMTAGVYYPIRIQYGQGTGSSAFQLVVYSNSIGNYTTEMTSNIFYNSTTNGF